MFPMKNVHLFRLEKTFFSLQRRQRYHINIFIDGLILVLPRFYFSALNLMMFLLGVFQTIAAKI